MFHEPAEYNWKHDLRRSAEAYRQLADQVWQEEALSCPDIFGRPDYGMGFRDGFVDYVYAGGTGEPPPVPPRHFWNVALRSPDGKVRANQWFDGYRHGAHVAREGGYRDLGIVHSSVFGLEAAPYVGVPSEAMSPIPTEADAFWPTEDFDPHTEILPDPENAPSLSPPSEFPEEPSDDPVQPDDAPADEAIRQEASVDQQEPAADQQQEPAAHQQEDNKQQEQQEKSVPAEPTGGEPQDDGPQNNEAAHESTPPTSPIFAADWRNVSAAKPARITPARSPAIAAERSSTDTANSTVRFVAEPPLSAPNPELAASEPSTLVQTSFVVKAPVTATRPRPESADPVSNEVQHLPSQPSNSAATSTIKIRADVNSKHTPHPSLPMSRRPSFVR